MRDTIVIDFDGTLCDDRHRDAYAKAGDWDGFHSLLHLDRPYDDVASLLRAVSGANVTVVAVTARMEKYRAKTFAWLNTNHLMPYIDAVLMRPDDNFDKAEVLKIKLLEEWATEAFADAAMPDMIGWTVRDTLRSRVMFVLEDRDKIVDAWREYGLSCWQVRTGAY